MRQEREISNPTIVAVDPLKVFDDAYRDVVLDESGLVYVGIKERMTRKDQVMRFFRDGANYFLGHTTDSYLRQVANDAVDAIVDGRVSVTLEETHVSNSSESDCFALDIEDKGLQGVRKTEANLIIYESLIDVASRKPLEVLAGILGHLSAIRDYANSRIISEETRIVATNRADATVAQFLHLVRESNPTLRDGIFDECVDIMDRYPKGINSLGGGRYGAIGRANSRWN